MSLPSQQPSQTSLQPSPSSSPEAPNLSVSSLDALPTPFASTTSDSYRQFLLDMHDFPPEVIQSWPIPNYDNPVTRGKALIVTNGIFISLAFIAVMLRVYARVCVSHWFGADDWCIVFALIFAIGMTICVLLANIQYGWDRHVWDVRITDIAGAFQIAFAAKMVFSLAAMFTRMGITLFYYRLVRDSGLHRFRMAVHLTLVFGIAVGVALSLVTIWQCTPIKAFWVYPQIPGSHCLDEGRLTLGCGIINTIADALVAGLPIPMIARLKMARKKRIAVMLLLGMGFIVVIAGIIRSYYVWKSLISTYDLTWYCYGLWIAAAVEIDLAVICSCAPAFRLLFASWTGRYMPTVASSISSFGSKIAASMSRSRSSPSAPTSRVDRKIDGVQSSQSMNSRSELWSKSYSGYPQSPHHMYDIQEVPLTNMHAISSFGKSPRQVETHIQSDPRSSDEHSLGSQGSSSRHGHTSRSESQSHILVERNINITSHPNLPDSATTEALNRYALQTQEKTKKLQERMKAGAFGSGGRTTPHPQ